MRLAGPVASALLAIAVTAAGALAADAPQTLELWPGNAPGEAAQAAPEQWTQPKPGEKGKRVTHVSKPTIEIFRPEKPKDTGVAVIVCPGGGYQVLMMDYEGEDVAAWLNTMGITGIVLKYRVPAASPAPRYLPALQDAQRAMSLVRSRAREWDLDPARIGMLGFSAGGHLTAAASTNFDKRAYEPIDATDAVSCRPDFGIDIYPGGIAEKGKTELSPEIRVTAQTPPQFIAMASDDPVNPDNAIEFYAALHRAGVHSDLHIYAAGGHGFGLGRHGLPCADWPQQCIEWLQSIKILKKAS